MKPVPECTHRLAAGRKCRGAALRGQPFCRHHDPNAAAPTQRPITQYERFSRHRRWIGIHHALPWFTPAEIPIEVFAILHALLEDGDQGISDREAGRLLRALLRRIGDVPFPLPDPDGPASEPPAPTPAWPPATTAYPAFSASPHLDTAEQTEAMIASLLRSASQPDLPHIQPSLPHIQPDPRHLRPNLPQVRPNPNCHAASRIAPPAAASAAPPAASAAPRSQSQLTRLQSPALVSKTSAPANR
jgi:hypothetical protein